MVSEKALIETYLLPLSQDNPSALAFRDDAALLSHGQGDEFIISKDLLMEGVHFLATDPAEAIAHKALAVNLSDIAAKAATPHGFFLGLGFPRNPVHEWLSAFCGSLDTLIKEHNCPLLGGDTTASKSGLTISVTIIGKVPQGGMVRRDTAKPGDLLYVSGPVGGAALGLKIAQNKSDCRAWGLKSEEEAYLLAKYQTPQPRTDFQKILKHYASAAMDISDGLIPDLEKLCEASSVGAKVSLENIPLAEPLKKAISKQPDLKALALGWGDDYELLFGVAAGMAEKICEEARHQGVDIYKIGELTPANSGLTFLDENGQPVDLTTIRYKHF